MSGTAGQIHKTCRAHTLTKRLTFITFPALTHARAAGMLCGERAAEATRNGEGFFFF